MIYQDMEGFNKSLPAIIQGCMMLSDLNDGQEKADILLDTCMEYGINAFDIGHSYGEWIEPGTSERALGNWCQKRGNRNDIIIIEKGCHPSQDRSKVTTFDIEADIHDSLARLKTDYIDIWMFHRDDENQKIGPLVEVCNKYLEKGKIKHYGFSNWSSKRIAEALNYCEMKKLTPPGVSSVGFSLAEARVPIFPGSIAISGPTNENEFQWYKESKMPILAWSSLARGFLSGRITEENYDETKNLLDDFSTNAFIHKDNWLRLKRADQLAREKQLTVPQIALSYVLSQQISVFALVGAINEDEIKSNIEALNNPLTKEEVAWLDLKTDRYE